MADKNENNGDASAKSSDAIFMMECLKHLQNPAAVDVDAVAAALEYKNPVSVANRVRVLKKKFDLQLTCTHGASKANGGNDSPTKGAKGAKAARGPIKAKAEPTDAEGDEAKPGATKSPKKPARKAASKSKKPKGTAAADDEVAKAESATVQDEDNEDNE